ncbi:hypothetical protein ACFU44_33300 [Nocardia rhizosphaerihabitans]|uniref:hypothetical protein n=1 Tax=Nocardia rhizosphaerihabitans TaxID=1691570 RepID=UPI003670F3A2
MKIPTKSAAIAALAAAAVALSVGSAHAEAVTSEVAPGVQYTGNTATGAATLSTPLGSVTMQPGEFGIKDGEGRTVFGDNDIAAPNTAVADVVEVGTPAPAAAPGGDLLSDLNQSVAAAGPHMGMAMGLGAIGGTIVGATLGCPFGIVTGGMLVALPSAGTLTLPAAVAGCITGAVAVGALGASIGSVAVAIPVGLAAGAQKYNQLQAQRAAAAAAGTPAQAG